MKQQWQKLALRVDAMQLRERVFLFLAILISALALADTVWLSPAQLVNKQAKLRFAAQGTELQRLRDELKSVAQPVDASKVVRDQIAEANLRLDAINQDIRAVAPQAEGGPAIEQALVQFLRRQEGLTLIRTATLAQDAVSPKATTTPAANTAAPAVLSRRGLELSVSGSYAELVRYVRTLENALPTMRWGNLQIKTTKQAPELTLQVYVVGVPP
jgi:MSHA biogenesis protein MshJ